MVKHQVRRYRYGYALTEIEWGVIEENGREWVVPVGLFSVEPRRFRLDRKTGEFRLLTEDLSVTGEALSPGKWLIGRAAVTDIARAGKMRTGSRMCLLKSAAVTNWAVYGNKYGIPLTLVKYDETEGENSKKVAEEIAANIGSDASAAVPKTVEIDIAEAGRMGDSSPLHSGMISFANNENSKLVVGGTLTNDSSGSSSQSQGAGSSHALGKVHENSRWSIVAAVAADVQETFYELARLFVEFNGLAGKAAPPRLQIQIARDWTPAAIVDAAGKMVNELGVPVSMAQLYAGTGFAAPEGAEDKAPGRVRDQSPPPQQQQEGTP
jgi:phage gp29-like protein